MAVLTACLSSGLAGVYFEMLVKTGAQTSIVIRNLQLGKKNWAIYGAQNRILHTFEHEIWCWKIIPLYFIGLFSLVFATMAVMYNDAKEVLENGFFQGYDTIVVLIVLIQVSFLDLLFTHSFGMKIMCSTHCFRRD